MYNIYIVVILQVSGVSIWLLFLRCCD